CDGRSVVNFSSNDYLGLAAHPRLREAAHAALDEAGAGAGASRLVCGNHEEHEALDAALASFKQTEAALSFSTGYAAALGTIPALVGEGDVVILDKLSHACLVDGARLSGAAIRVFPHNHIGKLESHLAWAREKFPSGRVLVVAESVYSMDGDAAPLREIVALKDRFGAWLMLDEAHGVGVIGAGGRGLAEACGVAGQIEVQMGTLGKALGSSGAYICGSARLRDFLINRARSFIFSTAPAPACAAASRAALEIVPSAEGSRLREALWKNIAALASGLGQAEPASAIIPVILGPETAALDASARLLEGGFLVPAIRYPTVARGAARLRFTVTAVHDAPFISRLADAWRMAGESPD
ncbi:MAG TPA: 8-amino-7-oxononanoate synthase, partial [Terrimicrobiaceae bacterium]|nr:8-amino-7-oxononanoate synthase [Terrimicrobiaceae bacterium]